jgi:rare lipoprotein A
MYSFSKHFIFLLIICLFCAVISPLESLAYVKNYTHTQVCSASWYQSGNKMSNGQYMRSGHFTAAHPFAPLGSVYLVTNLNNKKQVRVTITDRGPFIGGRCIDISKSAFSHIGKLSMGVIRVRLIRIE